MNKIILKKSVRKITNQEVWKYSFDYVLADRTNKSVSCMDFTSRKSAENKLKFRIQGLLNNGYRFKEN